jgi:hypothetical protein
MLFHCCGFKDLVVESWPLNSCHLPPGSCSEEARHISTSSPEWTRIFRAWRATLHVFGMPTLLSWWGIVWNMGNGCWSMSMWAPQQWRYCKLPFHRNQVWSYSLDLGICGSCIVNRPVLWSLPPLLGWHLCYWMELVNKWSAFGTAACKDIALHWLGLAFWGGSWASSQIPCLKFI